MQARGAIARAPSSPNRKAQSSSTSRTRQPGLRPQHRYFLQLFATTCPNRAKRGSVVFMVPQTTRTSAAYRPPLPAGHIPRRAPVCSEVRTPRPERTAGNRNDSFQIGNADCGMRIKSSLLVSVPHSNIPHSKTFSQMPHPPFAPATVATLGQASACVRFFPWCFPSPLGVPSLVANARRWETGIQQGIQEGVNSPGQP